MEVQDESPSHARALAVLLAVFTLACGGGSRSDQGAGDVSISSPVPAGILRRIATPPGGQYYHGVYPGGTSGEEDDITSSHVDSYEAAVGRRVAWVYFSHNWYRRRAFPLATAAWIRDRGAVPAIRLMLRSDDVQDHPEPVFHLDAILGGRLDADLRAWGDAARDFAWPLVVEWGTEMNGRWFSWNGVWNGGPEEGPRRFRDAFRRVVSIIRARGATNITWVFHANGDDVPDEAWNRLENYYPGDDVVDWLGVSIYGAGTPLDDEWSVFTTGMDAVIPRLASLAPGKPIFVLEFGATAGNPLGDPAEWADEALSSMLQGRWPDVRGFSWWNETWQNDDNPAHDTDMRVETVPGLAGVFRARLNSPLVLDRPIVIE